MKKKLPWKKHRHLRKLSEDESNNKTTVYCDEVGGEEEDEAELLGALFSSLNLTAFEMQTCLPIVFAAE